jgi:hypothetical protein
MLIPAIIVAALAVVPAPQDSDIEPIDELTVTLALDATDEGQELCVQVGHLAGTMEVLSILAGDPLLAGTLNDMATAYFKHSFEEGFGPEHAMTAEAEEAFYDWVEGCGL